MNPEIFQSKKTVSLPEKPQFKETPSTEHPGNNNRIVYGAFYTPDFIVAKIRECVDTFKDNSILLDPAGGYGAFIKQFEDWDYRVADIDSTAVKYLRTRFKANKVFHTDVFVEVNRKKYLIPEDSFLVAVGNPPYNDWTSLYKKGRKGMFKMDPDVFDRDTGIAFLKAMHKLRADIICILHPMSYLIKLANFKRLNIFFKHYILKKAIIFPSFIFEWTSKQRGFPVLIAMYEKNEEGFSWDNLLEFSFKFLFDDRIFKMKELQTTDGLINKYPRMEKSPIGLYFHTFRDINSLLRNKDFLLEPSGNTIPVNWENLSLYAYLVAHKHYILENNPRSFWFYGNFSPLIDIDFFSNLKNAFVHYSMEKTKSIPDAFKRVILEKFPWDGSLDIVKNYFKRLFNYAEKSNNI